MPSFHPIFLLNKLVIHRLGFAMQGEVAVDQKAFAQPTCDSLINKFEQFDLN